MPCKYPKSLNGNSSCQLCHLILVQFGRESDGHIGDTLLLTAGSTKLISDLQGSLIYRQVSLLLKNFTSNVCNVSRYVMKKEIKSKFYTDFFFLLQVVKESLKLKFTAYVIIRDLGRRGAGGQKEVWFWSIHAGRERRAGKGDSCCQYELSPSLCVFVMPNNTSSPLLQVTSKGFSKNNCIDQRK